MSFENSVIHESDYVGNDVASLPDDPSAAGISTIALKEAFDKTPKRMVGDKHNALVRALTDGGGAAGIGAIAQTGEISTIQNELEKLFQSFVAPGSGKGDMLRATYDTNGSNVVDNSERLGGLTLDQVRLMNHPVGAVVINTNGENPGISMGGVWELLCPGRTMVCVDTMDPDFATKKKLGGSKALAKHTHGGSTGYETQTHAHNTTVGSEGASHRHGITHKHKGMTDVGGEHDHAVFTRGFAQSTTVSWGYELALDKTGTKVNVLTDAGTHRHTTETTSQSLEQSGEGGGNHSHKVSLGAQTAKHNHKFTTDAAGTGGTGNLMPFMTCYIWERVR